MKSTSTTRQSIVERLSPETVARMKANRVAAQTANRLDLTLRMSASAPKDKSGVTAEMLAEREHVGILADLPAGTQVTAVGAYVALIAPQGRRWAWSKDSYLASPRDPQQGVEPILMELAEQASFGLE